MKAAAGIGNIVVGSAYLYLGLIIAEDLRRGWREMGFSHFGVGLAGLAFTCGPHHLVHGVHTLLQGRAGGPMDFATVLIGIPPGLVFLFLRSEALAGGRGDRFISGTPAWLASMPTVGGVYATALVAAAVQTRGDFALRPQMIANVVLIVLYTMIGSYIVRTQMRNRPQLGGWSVSGLSLALIFPTCTLMPRLLCLLGGQRCIRRHRLARAGRRLDLGSRRDLFPVGRSGALPAIAEGLEPVQFRLRARSKRSGGGVVTAAVVSL